MKVNSFITRASEIMKKSYGNGKKSNGKDLEEIGEITKLFSNIADLFIHVIRESPEFREKITEIHNEFLKYPESRNAISQVYSEISRYETKSHMESEAKLNRH